MEIISVVEARNIVQAVLLKFHIKLTVKPIDPAKGVRYLWKAAFDDCCKDDGIVLKPTDLWADAVFGEWMRLWQPLSG